MSWARAASRRILTVATVARQRGRAPQLAFIISSTRSAVVLGSTVTGFSSGTGGSFTLAHSLMMPCCAGFDMVVFLGPCTRGSVGVCSERTHESPEDGSRALWRQPRERVSHANELAA